jgi:hypothetical protein
VSGEVLTFSWVLFIMMHGWTWFYYYLLFC